MLGLECLPWFLLGGFGKGRYGGDCMVAYYSRWSRRYFVCDFGVLMLARDTDVKVERELEKTGCSRT
jgi:hypothetical protein